MSETFEFGCRTYGLYREIFISHQAGGRVIRVDLRTNVEDNFFFVVAAVLVISCVFVCVCMFVTAIVVFVGSQRLTFILVS